MEAAAQQRVQEEIQKDPSKLLALANFPTLGVTEAPIGASGPPLDFLKRVKESEEERRRREAEAAENDPNGILGKSPEALAAAGWAVLSLSASAVRASWERVSEWKPIPESL